REAAAGRRPAAALDRLGLLHARLTQVRVQVDEPGAHHTTRRVDDIGIDPGFEAGGHLGDHASRDPHIRLALAGRVDHAATADHDVSFGHACSLVIADTG